ncbi:ABC transporter permease [Caenispirillum bisanense]|uniref:Osmoprotectant transport system permease protein n=1 Tax=Caenispirillum bisanense TaxID=414052 RepID=A0A286H1K7_9PROT|nr:ABC transporter permease [Caenispirillum bisanense]SOE01668.1 osmoprotectant transport system permease protein [Caenispirillum bisanense]
MTATILDDGRRRLVADRVLLTLWVAGAAAVLLLPFASMAPNRLVSGQPVMLWAALLPWQAWTAAGLAALLLLSALATPLPRALAHGLTLAAAWGLALLVLYGIGTYAGRAVTPDMPAARVSLGSAFWVVLFCAALAMLDAFQRLKAGMLPQVLYAVATVGAVAGLFALDLFDDLSILREYANREDAFAGEFLTHLALVGAALGPALLLGLPLGLLARRRAKLRGGLFGLLNFFQTIPSIALFALLVAPLSALGDAVPVLKAVGIKGIGAAPAVIALVMYSLLPIVRNTYAGFAGVPAAAVEAARGMGMTTRQVLWRVEVPLALPVILSGLRIVTVQAIGLTVVAALIGAGGLGTFIFQGLGQYAIDLVLLGAIPTIFLAVTADFFLQILVALSKPEGAR